MQQGAANRVINSATEVLKYLVRWDRMLVNGSRVCTVQRHLEGPNKSGCDPGMAWGRKT